MATGERWSARWRWSRPTRRPRRRAQRLLAPLLPRERGPAEADLAAVRAPDGTPLFFCRTGPGGWPGDFDPVRTSTAGIGVVSIDHIGLSEPFDRFDEAALFHRAVLGLTPESADEFAAPFGLIRGRAFADRDRTVRLALTVARLRRGDWAPAVAEPQYVASAVGDLLGGRLFLLLVQRLDGYDGYGWADAPVRMTAHRRNRLVRTG